MYALEIAGLEKTYANGVQALKGIDLQVKQGDFFALLGANGAGKSTTIGLITTLIMKTAGQIWINGHNLDTNSAEAKASIGLVPQEINLNVFETAEQILLNQAGYYGVSRSAAKQTVESLLKSLGLWPQRDVRVNHFSGGMKRRLMIARGLVHKPSLLILDEPTAGVDIEIRRSVWEFLLEANKAGTTIILTTHYLEEAEQLCKHVAIIDKGVILENTSMQALLKTLRHQTFVFSLKEPFNAMPNVAPFTGKLVDPNTLELKVDKQYTLNEVFAVLERAGVNVISMRNKTNRLEELFLDIIHNDK